MGDKKGGISEQCLRSIYKVEGGDREIGRCRPDNGSESCGPYQIKENYWKDCKEPGGDYKTCTTQKDCSEKCINSYMDHYATEKRLGHTPTCEDYSRIHNGGPNGHLKPATDGYWDRVKAENDRK